MTIRLLKLLNDNARAKAERTPVRVEAQPDAAHIYIYDVIDAYWGASAADLVRAFAAAGDKPVVLHINSPGGDVFEARAMTASIMNHAPGVTAVVEGICASAATLVACACASTDIIAGAMYMVHNSWTLAYGNKRELAKTADLLAKVDVEIAATYVRLTGQEAEQIVAWMDEETWFTADEAVAAGFAAKVHTPGGSKQAGAQAAAHWNLSAYEHAPRIAAPEPEPATEPLQASLARQQQLNRSRLALLHASI